MIFLQIFLKILRRPHGDPPYKPSLGGPCFPPPKKIPLGANAMYFVFCLFLIK